MDEHDVFDARLRHALHSDDSVEVSAASAEVVRRGLRRRLRRRVSLSVVAAGIAVAIVGTAMVTNASSSRPLHVEGPSTGPTTRVTPNTNIQANGVIALPTHENAGVNFAGQVGVLASDGRCFWLDVKAHVRRRAVVWPQGYSGRTDPLRIVDAKGRVVFRVGDRVSLTGGGGPIPPNDNCGLGQKTAFYGTP